MARDAIEALLSYIQTDERPRRAAGAADTPPVVTIARDHGSGGRAIAELVAERLGVRCFGKPLLDAVVRGAEADPGLMRRLDDELPPRAGTGLYAALMGLKDPLHEYRRVMNRVVDGIAFRGGVIVGRGAHLLVHAPRALRVRIVGSEEVCARRLAGGDVTQVAAKLDELRGANADRARYIRQCFDSDLNDPRLFDLVINTDRIADPNAAADLIVAALNAVGR